MKACLLGLSFLSLAGCVSYQNDPPPEPCGGCPAGQRCCEDEDLCWPEGSACPCQGVVCDQPPGPACQDPLTLRVYAAPGQCRAGTCSYPFADHRCETGVCLDGACQGGCAGGGCVSDADCDDGNPCTAEACQASCCYSDPVPDGLACDDGDECTAEDACEEGVCRGLPVPGCRPCATDGDCDDLDVCTEDRCEARGCVHQLLQGAPCDDGDPCTSVDTCGVDGCAGWPVPGCGDCATDPGLCDDANPCTVDVCENGMCWHEVVDGLVCDDGDRCTSGDVCTAGICLGTPLADVAGILPSYALESTCQGFGPLPEVWFHRVDRCSFGMFYNDGWLEGGDVCTLTAAPNGGWLLRCADWNLECSAPADLDPWAFTFDCGGCALSFTADEACYRNADCPAGRSCQVLLGPAGLLDQECQWGSGQGYDNTGASCTNDSQCFSGWCLQDASICNGLCVSDADCRAVDPGLSCVDEVIQDAASGILDVLRRCRPAP